RVVQRGGRWEKCRQLLLCVGGQLRNDQPTCLAGIGAEDGWPPCIGDDADPPARRQRLSGQTGGQRQHLVESLGSYNAGRVEQGVDGHITGSERRGVRTGRATPQWVRPALTAMIGLQRLTRRAMRAKRRGLPKDSTYRMITSVIGSSSQYCKRSLVETSALFPTLTKDDMPMWKRRAPARVARPRAPLCDDIATRPVGGNSAVNVALSRTFGSVLIKPKQFGPIMRIPCWGTLSANCFWSAAPSTPTSANPAVITTSAQTPLAAQSSTTDNTLSRGTAITARSTCPGTARKDG